MYQYRQPQPVAALLIAFCMVTTLWAAAPLLAAAETGEAAKVVALRGPAVAIDADGVERPLAPGDTLAVSDTIRTGPGGRLQLMFSDNTIIGLGTNAELEVSRYQWDGDTGALTTTVKEGSFRVMGGAIARTSPQNFTTETPSATIGIRGSMYAGRVSDGALTVVFQGGTGITVSNSAGTVEITTPGMGTRVRSSDEEPEEPSPFGENDLAELEDEDEGTTEEEGEGEGEAGEEEEGGGEDETTGEDEDADEGAGEDEESTGDEWDDTTLEDDDTNTDDTTDDTTTETEIDEVTSDASQDDLTEETEETADTTTTLSGRGIMTLHDDAQTELFSRYGSATMERQDDGVTTTTVGNYQLPFTFNWSTSGTSYSGPPNSVDIESGAYYQLDIEGETFDNYGRYLSAGNLGEFAYLELSDDPADQLYEHNSLIYAGTPATNSQMPTTGVDNYIGVLGGMHTPTDANADEHEGFTEEVSMEINWASKKVIGTDYDQDAYDNGRQEAVFFFGDLGSDRSTFDNITVIGRDYYESEQIDSDTIYSTSVTGQVYGSEYQGLGFYGSGTESDVFSLETQGDWDVAGGMFRDPADHSSSDTGQVDLQGFLAGVATGIDTSDSTKATPIGFRNSASTGLTVTIDRDTGRLDGTASAEGDMDWSLENIKIGHQDDNAYRRMSWMIILSPCSTPTPPIPPG
ncbi:MAG: FecR domain-containing protein [Desulfurivibrio sp.]|nr:FecR domain-containing protein [Desulfurivibrio sp.]